MENKENMEKYYDDCLKLFNHEKEELAKNGVDVNMLKELAEEDFDSVSKFLANIKPRIKESINDSKKEFRLKFLDKNNKDLTIMLSSTILLGLFIGGIIGWNLHKN